MFLTKLGWFTNPLKCLCTLLLAAPLQQSVQFFVLAEQPTCTSDHNLSSQVRTVSSVHASLPCVVLADLDITAMYALLSERKQQIFRCLVMYKILYLHDVEYELLALAMVSHQLTVMHMWGPSPHRSGETNAVNNSTHFTADD